MKSKVSATIKYLVFLSIGAALMYFAFRNVDLAEMWTRITTANFWWILLSLVFSTIAHASRAYRWGMLIEVSGKRPAFLNLFYSLSTGYFANMAFPRLGEVTRCTALYEVEKTPVDSMIGTVIVERVIDLISLFILMILVLLVNMEKFSGIFIELAQKKSQSLQTIPLSSWLTLACCAITMILGLIILQKNS